MLDHSIEAVSLIRDKNRTDLDNDRVLSLALIRLLEIIGEAANRIPKNERKNYADIPWPQIISLRNRLIHGYDSVDMEILWQIVSNDLPALISTLEDVLSS